MTYWVLKIRCWTLVLIICETVPCKVHNSLGQTMPSNSTDCLWSSSDISSPKKKHYVSILFEACRRDICMRGGSSACMLVRHFNNDQSLFMTHCSLSLARKAML